MDFTPPEPGPIGDASLDMVKNDECDAAFNHPERCIDVTYQPNHRYQSYPGLIINNLSQVHTHKNTPLAEVKFDKAAFQRRFYVSCAYEKNFRM